MKKKTITVFGSSLPREGEPEFVDAFKLGQMLAGKGFIVCTGGYQGIMNAVSKGAVENGGKAIGITVKNWGAKPSKYLSEEIKCENLFARINKLVDVGDGFVILRGGTGTLLELAVVWEYMNKHIIETKPVACHSSLWKEIVFQMEKQIEVEKRVNGLIKYFKNIEDIAGYLAGRL